MENVKISQSHIKSSQTLRLPSNIIEDIEALSNIKNTSLNQVMILSLEYLVFPCKLKFSASALRESKSLGMIEFSLMDAVMIEFTIEETGLISSNCIIFSVILFVAITLITVSSHNL